MDCPICGKHNDNLEIVEVNVDTDGLYDYVFHRLLEQGIIVDNDFINTVMDTIDEYIVLKGDIINDDEKGSIG